MNGCRFLAPVPSGTDWNLWRLVTTSAPFAELQHGLDLSYMKIWSRDWKATKDTRVPAAYKLVWHKLGSRFNECMLFHGTDQVAAKAMCSSGVATFFVGVSTGTLYGDGTYFADSIS